MKNQAKLLVPVLGLALLLFTASITSSYSQVVYNEGFEITNGSTVTYAAAPVGLASMPMGWSTSKYCTTVGGYTAGTCFATAPGFSRYGVGANPTCTPRTGSTMLGFNSFWINNGEKSYVTSKKLDINTIGANNLTGSIWMYRDSGLYNATFDSISIHVQTAQNGPSLQSTAKRVTLNGTASAIPRSYSQVPATTANSWYQINFTIPNADVVTWSTQGIYIIIMGHSADGNTIFMDDFSITEYPLAAPAVVAGSAGVTLQNTATTQPSVLNQLIIGCKITATGSNATTATKLTLNNWTFNTNGSNSPPTDISAAKLWWTGGTNAFDPALAVLIGTVANPWATNYTFLTTAWGGGVDPTKWIQYGDNYFWITYDIAPGANSGNYVDAEWVSAQASSPATLSLSPQSLSGALLIDIAYCTPAYAVGTAWSGYTNNDYVQCVQLDDLLGTGGINNGPLGNTPQAAAGPNCPTPGNPCGFQSHPPDYEFFLPGTNKTAILTTANTYQIKVACGTQYSSNYIAAWIDYNKSGTFANTINTAGALLSGGGGEKICQTPSLVNSGGSCTGPAGSNFTQTFTIPADALPGNTRLRVREVYATSQIDPCAAATYGETEDYVVTIIPPCAPAWIGWKTWLGFTDDWNNPANWCGGVPTINDNARIPQFGAGPNDRPGYKMPRLKSGITAVAKNLRIEAPATTSDTSAFLIDAAAMGANGLATASLTIAEDMSALTGARIKVISDLRDTAQLSNGTLRTPTVSSTNEPFSNVLKKRIFYVYTQSDMFFDGVITNDIIDTILIHVKRNGTTTEPMRNFTIKYYYTDGTIPGFSFNGAPFTGAASTNYRNMPNVIGATTTIYGPTDLATSTFIPVSGSSGTIVLPLIPNSFKWNGSTNKLVIEMVWDNTSSGIVPLGGTEGTTFTQTSTQGYRHFIGITQTRVTPNYPAANFVVPFSALPQTSTAGAITWAAGGTTLSSTYANATFAVGQWVSGSGLSVIKSALTTVVGNGTINIATGTTGIQVGMYVNPTAGWAAGAAPVVTAVTGTTVTVSPAPTVASASATMTFCPYITALSSATPPYATITVNCALPGAPAGGNLGFGILNTSPLVGVDYRSNLTFKVRRPYGKFPIEVRKDWVNQGEFVPGVSRVSMTTTTAGVVDSMYNAVPTSFYDLVINNADGVKMFNADITVKDTLTLTAGRLKANNQLISLANDTIPGVLVRTSGGIQLDADVLGSDVAPYGRFRWLLGSATGSLDIPLYNQANTYIPFTYNRVSGKHDLTLASYGTTLSNQNLPQSVNSFTSFNNLWTNGSGVVDRFYWISNNGLNPVASLTFRYANAERATYSNTNMRVQRWLGSKWEKPNGFGGTFPFPGQVHTVSTPSDAVLVPNFNLMSPTGQWMTIVNESAPLSDTTAVAVFINGVFSVCQGSAATLTATAGFVSYLWNTGATTQTINPTTAGTYTVTATTASGSTVSASEVVTIFASTPLAISGSTTICLNNSTTLTATSGLSSYVWSNGASTSAITVSPTTNTTYTVTATNSNGCTSSASTLVTVNANPTASISGTYTVCQGNVATLTASAASSYLWSTGATTQTINPAIAGTYTVTVTNVNGCTGSASRTVVVNSNPAPSISGTTSICQGSTTTLSATAGFNSYLWSTGATTSSIVASTAGAYTVTATNVNGCTGSTTSTVTVNANPTPVISGATAICQSGSTTLTATQGFSSYLWSTGETTSGITVNPASNTSYTVTVTNANGCSGITSISVAVNSNPNPGISGTFTVCQGSAATLTSSVASSYLWSTGATSQTINPSTAGSYTVTVTNTSGCTGSATQVVTINSNPVPAITGATVICQGASTTLTATTGFSSYLWNTGATTSSITTTVAANYTVTVTNSSGCTGSSSTSVTVNANPTPSITGTFVVCQGSTASLTASSGFSSYLWNTGSTSQTINPATSGTYTVTVTSAGGCTGSNSQAVTVNPTPSVSITGITNICQGSSTSLSATTGYSSYLWNTGATTATISTTTAGTYTVTATSSNGCTGSATVTVSVVQNPSPTISGIFSVCQGTAATLTATGTFSSYLWSNGATTQTINPVLSGIYTVTVTNSSGCIGSASQSVTVNANPAPTISGVTSICQGSSTTLTATAGFNSYAWSNGATTQSISVSAAGTYTVSVTNSLLCTGTTSVNVSYNNPSPSISGPSSICQGSSATFSATAGFSSYLWSNGSTASSITTSTAGTYTVTVTNSSGCSGSTSKSLTVNTNPVPTISGTSPICQGTSTTLTATSGFSSYLWSTSATTSSISVSSAATYTVTVTNTNGCTGSATKVVAVNPNPTPSITGNTTICQGLSTTLTATSGYNSYSWSTGAVTSSITTSSAGAYTVTVTNSNGCTGTASTSVTVIATPVPSITGTFIVCQGTAASLTASSGYTSYLWSTGATSQTINPISSGNYTVTVTNVNGCSGSNIQAVTVNANPVPTITGLTTICQGTSTTLTATSGFNSYLWNTGATTSSIITSTAGTYTVTVTNTNLCTGTANANLTVNPAATAPIISGTFAVCQGSNATLNASAGYSSYLWNTGATTQTINPSTGGTYTVTATNTNGCTASASQAVTINSNPVPVISGNTSICQGSSTTLTASTGFNSYLWSTGAITSSITTNVAGAYTVTVTNSNGCSGSASQTVVVNPIVTASVSISSNNAGPVISNTSITFTATPVNGGSSPTYQWRKNGVNVGVNSNTYTNNSWVNLDVVTCVMTSNASCVTGSPATSNAITVTVSSATPKFVISDVTANRAYYYDSTFAFVVSNPLSTTVLNGNTNASDVFMTSSNGYILDGVVSGKVYRSTQANTASTGSRTLRSNTGAAINPTTGLIIRGDTLYILDRTGRAIYSYYLSQAFNGLTTNLNAFAKKTLLTANSASEAIGFDNTYFYVLDNGTSIKSIYRYPLVGTATGVRSRPMLSTLGTALSTISGLVVDGNNIWVTDRGLDFAYSFDKTLLFTGSNTVNLNATSINNLNSGNLNATGISITNTTSLLREMDSELPMVLQAWPNPTGGVINLSLEGLIQDQPYVLRAFDMAGRLIAQHEESGASMILTPAFDFTGIRPGIYAIVVEQGTRRKTIRIVVE